MAIDFEPNISYLEYIKQNQVEIAAPAFHQLTQLLDNCQWEQPETALDLNNLAVAALVAAESCDNAFTHDLYVEIACDAVQAGFELNQHPLCAAHLALLNCMLGNYSEAAQIAFSAFINNLQPAYNQANIQPGIVYIPPLVSTHITNSRSEQLQLILNTNNGYDQAILMLSGVLCRTQISLDNQTGLRLLNLIIQLMPNSISSNIRLGIYNIGNQQLEGLIYLHRANKLAPSNPIILQSLYLAYRDLEQPELVNYWQQIGLNSAQHQLDELLWQWTKLKLDSPWTYIPFIGAASLLRQTLLLGERRTENPDMLMTVPASLQSLTTRCLLAEGDWFERELEFWRQYVQPGMTVIDVGAGVGVYTFSAAQLVGTSGVVYAIEPFSGAVNCLQETCRINQIENVKILQNAVGDREGNVKLILQSTSELNYLAPVDTSPDPDTEVEEVVCITLDTLIQQARIDRVEVIKISTEGNELAVLIGSEQILATFAPTIVYHRYANKGIDLEAAQYLIDRGYELFRYQPYLQQLIPLVSETDFAEVVKAIAIPK
jgi:FkbM family methyltransferase